MRHQYYRLDDSGDPVPCGLLEAAVRFEIDDRVVWKTRFGEVEVSTVFLGLDHAFEGPPLLFETLVFGGELDGQMERYSTRQSAIAGHDQMVAKVRDSQGVNK